jgi:hypothetical protein
LGLIGLDSILFYSVLLSSVVFYSDLTRLIVFIFILLNFVTFCVLYFFKRLSGSCGVRAGRARASRRNERHRGTFREDERRTFLAAQTKPSKYGHVSAVRVIARVLLKVESAHVLCFFNRWHASMLGIVRANLSLSVMLCLSSVCNVIAVPVCVH